MTSRRLLITAGPPTSNGDLHIGHLSGPYVAADVFARCQRMAGREVYFLSAGDDHQSYVARKAAQRGTTPRETAAHYCQVMAETLRAAGVQMTFFGHPAGSEVYGGVITDVCRVLHANGELVARRADTLFCPKCDRSLFEAHVRGICRYCGAAADGGICEACGRPNTGEDLVEPRCSACGTEPTLRPATRLFFPLERHREYVERYVGSVTIGDRHQALLEAVLSDQLPDVPVTQATSWGLPVPVQGFEDQRISAWFELGPHYLAATADMCAHGRAPGDWRHHWCDSGAEVVQFFGYDSCYFHTILFPAVFRAYDPSIRPPVAFISNEFFRLDGKKFSTSRNHAVWGSEFLRRHQADAMRFYLGYVRPEAEQTNFTVAEYEGFIGQELRGEWDGWLGELKARVADECGGVCPRAGAWRASHWRFRTRVEALYDRVRAAYGTDGYSLQAVVRALIELVRESRRFGKLEGYFAGIQTRREERATALALELAAANALALSAAPLMPRFAATLWRDLGNPTPVADALWSLDLPPIHTGQPVGLHGHPYFA